MRNTKVIISVLILYFGIISNQSYSQDIAFKPNVLNAIHIDIDTNLIKIDTSISIEQVYSLTNVSEKIVFRPVHSKNIFSRKYNTIHYAYEQYYNEIRIEKSDLRLHFKNGLLSSYSGNIAHNISMKNPTFLSKLAALEKVRSQISSRNHNDLTKIINPQSEFSDTLNSDLLIDLSSDVSPRYLYKTKVCYKNDISSFDLYIDATTGEYVHSKSHQIDLDGTATTKYYGTRTIQTQFWRRILFPNAYRLRDDSRGLDLQAVDFNHSTSPDLYITSDDNVWTSGDFSPADKQSALDAFWSLQQIYDYFYETFDERESYDNQNSDVAIAMNYYSSQSDINSASWQNGIIALGEGDGIDWERMSSLDIVAHEYAHGITGTYVDFDLNGMERAINEALSDIWAAIVESKVLNTTSDRIWTMGEDPDISTDNNGLRSLKDPNSEGCAAVVDDAFWGDVLNCGSSPRCWAYENSGVMSHWFYLLVTGDHETVDISPLGIDLAADLIYELVTGHINSSTEDYNDVREQSIAAGYDIFDRCGDYVSSIQNAWFAVGVGNPYVPCTTHLDGGYISSSNVVNDDCVFIVEDTFIGTTGGLTLNYEDHVLIEQNFGVSLGGELLIQ